MKKVIRTATIPLSLDLLLPGQLSFLNEHYEIVAVSGQDKHLENVAIREKVRTQPVEMQRNVSPLKDLRSLISLYKLFKKEKPLIVHSITPKAGLLSMVAAYFAGVPVRMHTFTGLIFPSRKGIMQKIIILMDKLLCFFATHIYPEGSGVKNDLETYKITSKPLKILANGNVNGIDTNHFNRSQIPTASKEKLRSSLGIQPTDFVFIFVGRLVTDKGINELAQAFKNLASAIPTPNTQHPTPRNTKLLLVGPLESDLDTLLPETLQEIEQNKAIIHVGYQEDVRPFYAIADALAFPSYREGFPNVVLQSLAMELPAIVTNINGCNEIITHQRNGLIVPIKDTPALQQAMKQILTNPSLYHKLQSATKDSIAPYEQSLVWAALLSEYRSITENAQ